LPSMSPSLFEEVPDHLPIYLMSLITTREVGYTPQLKQANNVPLLGLRAG
jgi:hypothetical protein